MLLHYRLLSSHTKLLEIIAKIHSCKKKDIWCSLDVNFHALAVYSRQEWSDIRPSDTHTNCVFQIKIVHCAGFMQTDGLTDGQQMLTPLCASGQQQRSNVVKMILIISLATYNHCPVSPRK